MRVLVTGSAGLIGTWLTRQLHDKGHHVIGIDDLSGGTLSYSDGCYKEFYQKDLTQDYAASLVKSIGADVVYHCACHPREGLSSFCPTDIAAKSTCLATMNTLVGAINGGCKTFVQMSSMARYGDAAGGTPPFEESCPCTPSDPYGAAKLCCDQWVKILCDTHGVRWNIAIPHNAFGEYVATYDPYRNVIAIWANRMLRGKKPLIYGDGSQERAPSYMRNWLEPMLRLGLDNSISGEIVNIGGERAVTINELCEMVMHSFGWSDGAEYAEARPNEVHIAHCSVAKSERLLGYKDEVSLEEGIQKTVDWIKSIGPVEPRFLEKYEIDNLVPRVWKERLV